MQFRCNLVESLFRRRGQNRSQNTVRYRTEDRKWKKGILMECLRWKIWMWPDSEKTGSVLFVIDVFCVFHLWPLRKRAPVNDSSCVIVCQWVIIWPQEECPSPRGVSLHCLRTEKAKGQVHAWLCKPVDLILSYKQMMCACVMFFCCEDGRIITINLDY